MAIIKRTVDREVPDKYVSRGKVISRSYCHHDMWIIDDPETGKFHTINTVASVMAVMHPPDYLKN